MGVFQTMVEVVNRTDKPLTVRFDGQETVLEPNYDSAGNRIEGVRNMLPVQTVQFAKIQNVLMGSENPWDPSDFTVLVGAVAKPGQKQKDDLTFCPQSEEPTRVKLAEYLDDDSVTIVQRGKKNSRRASLGETAVPAKVDAASFKR